MGESSTIKAARKLTIDEQKYLKLGKAQPGGKLPLFDENGQKIRATVIKACLEKGFAEPWFANPIKPDWLVCRLTKAGRHAVG